MPKEGHADKQTKFINYFITKNTCNRKPSKLFKSVQFFNKKTQNILVTVKRIYKVQRFISTYEEKQSDEYLLTENIFFYLKNNVRLYSL